MEYLDTEALLLAQAGQLLYATVENCLIWGRCLLFRYLNKGSLGPAAPLTMESLFAKD